MQRRALGLVTAMLLLAGGLSAADAPDGRSSAVATDRATDQAAAAAARVRLYADFDDPRPLVGQVVSMRAAYGRAAPGQRILLQRSAGKGYQTVAESTVPPTSGGQPDYDSYTFTVTLTHASTRATEYRFLVLDGKRRLARTGATLRPGRQNPKLTSLYSDATARPGSPVTVTGVVAGAQTGTRVALERQARRGWRPVARARARQGAYQLTAPAPADGRYLYRVTSTRPRTASTPKQVVVGPEWRPGKFPGRSAPPGPVPDDPEDYAFFRTPPPRWNPCTTTRYRINPDRAPAGAVADVREAMRRLSQATGVPLEYAGATSAVPGSPGNGAYPADTQILVAWVRPGESSHFPADETAAGRGGSTFRSGYRDARGREELLNYRGFVLLNADRPLPTGFGGPTLGTLVMHEAGHTFGLAHARGPRQVMFDTLTEQSPAEWGAGDRNGLRRVGAEQGCVYDRDGSVAPYPAS